MLGQLVSAATLFAKFHAGERKSLSDFRPPLLEQPIKFVSNFSIVVHNAEPVTIVRKSHLSLYSEV